MNIEQHSPYLDHFFQQTRAHHVQLSAMADLKANMILTAASLVLTFSIRYLTEPALQWAVLTLILFCLSTIAFAIYATMPKMPLSRHGSPKPDPTRATFNLLFFGSFIDLPYEEYATAMENVANDRSKAYEAMTREVYTLGVFLARKKYLYLRWAYLSFLSGLFSSVLVFALTQLLTFLGFGVWQLDISSIAAAG